MTVNETWASRELPILCAVLTRSDAGEMLINLPDIQQELGFETTQMRVALQALHDADYIEVGFTMGGGRLTGHITRVYERTRRELGSWPSPESVVDNLASDLAAAADDEVEPERRGRLRAAGEALAGAAHEIAVEAIAARLGRL